MFLCYKRMKRSHLAGGMEIYGNTGLYGETLSLSDDSRFDTLTPVSQASLIIVFYTEPPFPYYCQMAPFFILWSTLQTWCLWCYSLTDLWTWKISHYLLSDEFSISNGTNWVKFFTNQLWPEDILYKLLKLFAQYSNANVLKDKLRHTDLSKSLFEQTWIWIGQCQT